MPPGRSTTRATPPPRDLGARQGLRRPGRTLQPGRGLETARRATADAYTKYLVNKAPYLDYPTALSRGWLVATGVIEGACRHLVKDRMDLTGARWSLEGAEAILKLRAAQCNGDFDDYWRYHLAQEHQRVHQSRYAHGVIPQAA